MLLNDLRPIRCMELFS